MPDVVLTTPDGLSVAVSPKAFRALQSWPDLDVSALVSVAGEAHACRRSTGLPHAQSVRDLVGLVDAPAVSSEAHEAPSLPGETCGHTTIAAPRFGVEHPSHIAPDPARPRSPIHSHSDHLVYVPLLDDPSFAVMEMRDFYRLRDAGLQTRYLCVERVARTKRRPSVWLHLLARPPGARAAAVRVAELLCPGDGPVAYMDGNPANLLPSNLRRTSSTTTPIF